MKVLHVYRTYFPDPPGGLQEAIRQICLATATFGVESRIFTLSPTPYPRDIDAPEGIVTRSRSWGAPASCDLGGIDAILQFRALSKWADIIHFQFPWPFADVLHLLNGSTKPAIMTYQSDIVRQRAIGYVYGPLMRKMMRSMSAVVATSPAYAKNSPVLLADVAPNRLHVIPLGIQDYANLDAVPCNIPSSLERLQLNGAPFILALGVLRYYKGLHTLIEAASLINGTIVIAGSGPEEIALKQKVVTTGAKNIIFAGQVTDQEKQELLQQCRALVFPSHLKSEAFGMVLVEASMFGKPMVCCEIGSGTSFVNLHGETGFVVPPESPFDLAKACNRLFEDRVLAQKMGIAARNRYESLFSEKSLGKAYSELYRKVLNSKNNIR
jgi:glycosyltransferase involved in cell wall biosynthesis